MSEAQAPHDETRRTTILRRADQACAATIIAASLLVIAGYWLKEWARQDDFLDVARDPPPHATFLVDINAASWTELALLPGVGETLGKRIVQSRASDGPFRDHEDLLRVRGIGRKTLERIRPYLAPVPRLGSVAGS